MSRHQVPDKLIYKGQEWSLNEYDYPMEDYFRMNPKKDLKEQL